MQHVNQEKDLFNKTENQEILASAEGCDKRMGDEASPASLQRRRRMPRLRPRAFVRPVAAVSLAAAIGAGGMFSYFTDEDSVDNVLSVASDNLSIQVVEQQWSQLPDEDGDGIPDAAQNMLPSQWVVKDPKVVNGGTDGVGAYVMARVSVPVADVSYQDDEGKTVQGEGVELFAYQVASDKWSEVGSPVVENGCAVHSYRYADVLSPGEETPVLFDRITLINLVNGQGQAGEKVVNVTAVAIQEEGFATADEAWEAYEAQKRALDAANTQPGEKA